MTKGEENKKHNVMLQVMRVLDDNRVNMFDAVSIVELVKHRILQEAFKVDE